MKKSQLCRFISLLLLFASTGLRAQIKWPHFVQNLEEKLFFNKVDSTRPPSFLPLPTLSYAPEKGAEVGVVGLYSFYTDRKDPQVRNSSIGASVSYTTKKQTYFKLVSDIWSPGNKYHYTTEMRYRNFPFQYYGLGNNTKAADKELLNEKRIRINGEVDKQIAKKWYTGIRMGYDYYAYTNETDTGVFATQNVYGKKGGKIFFAGVAQVYDSRDNNTYSTRGQMAKLTLNYAPDFWGGENYKGGFMSLDYSGFRRLSDKLVFGLNAKYQSYFSSSVPFYLLPQLGSDAIMRGYYQGRYRDKNMAAVQSELRYRIIPRFGLVLFGGVGQVYGNYSKLAADQLKPNYGGGIRYFFDLERNLSVRVDYGIGQKVPGEKRQSGIYFSLGEAF